MNGETMVVSKVSRGEMHRTKRIKMDDLSVKPRPTFHLPPTIHQSSNNPSRERLRRKTGTPEMPRKNNKEKSRLNHDMMAARAAQVATADASSLGNALSQRQTSSSASSRSEEFPSSSALWHSPSSDTNYDASARLSLRIWMAQNVRHSRDSKLQLKGPPLSEDGDIDLSNSSTTKPSTMRSISTARTMFNGKSRKEESRGGKAVREINGERSVDRDGGVWPRLNGTDEFEASDSSKRSVTPKIDSVGQHLRHKFKQPKITTDKAHESPVSSYRDSHFDKAVHSISVLMKTALLPVDGYCKINVEAVNRLRFALEHDRISQRSLVKAFGIMAADSDILKYIKDCPDLIQGNDKLKPASKKDDMTTSCQEADIGPVPSTQSLAISSHQSNEIIRSLNAATALLNEMADTKVYVTPYANPPPRGGPVNGYGTHKSNGVAGPSNLRETDETQSLDQLQIDALLALANGGSLSDDEDDKTIADPDEFVGQPPDQKVLAQADIDITATLQLIINQLMAERKSHRFSDPTASAVDPYGSQSVRDQAALLQSLFSQAGVSINTVIPAAQSHATSQLYAHLSSRVRSSTPNGGINPTNAHVYGNTTHMNHKMLTDPLTLGQIPYMHNHSLQPLHISPRENTGTVPRLNNHEEQKKIRSYGFPPLPGSRSGVRR